MDAIAWTGSILLALCGLPLAIKSARQGHSRGIDPLFLAMWGLGEALLLIYSMHIAETALMVNYWINLLAVAVVRYYLLYPRRDA